MSSTMEERVGAYQAWRLRQPRSRPMLGLLWEPDIPPLPEFLDRVGDRAISAQDIDPEMYLPHIERWYQRSRELPGDTIQRFSPAFGIPWMEAIAGCPVVAHPGSLWASPTQWDYEDRSEIRFSPDCPWFGKLMEFVRAMIKHAAGRFPVAVPQMRGPLDILAAMRTPAQMCVDMIECPDEVARILAELTDLSIAVGNAVLEEIPAFCGGYVTRMNMWAPGKALTVQNDVSTLVSPSSYQRFVGPCDRRIADAWPFSDFHMHASEHHQIDGIVTLTNLTAIELTLEHTLGGPPLEMMLDAARRILKMKPLLLACFDSESAARCLQDLPNAGLCIFLTTSEPEVPKTFDAWLRDHCRE